MSSFWGTLYTIEALAEVVYVLTKVYALNRNEVSVELIEFFDNTNCRVSQQDAIIIALKLFGEKNLDFVDCVLVGYKTAYKTEIITFDKKLNKLLSKT